MGKLGNFYFLAFHRNIFYNHLYIAVEPVSERGGIHIMERKILHRQPVAAWRYKCGKDNEIVEAPEMVKLDMWWGDGENNYRKE